MYLVQKHVVRAWLKDEHKRVDGRGIDEIRPLNAEIDLLDRVHGSGLFTRGQTQVLSITTLGPMSDCQQLDGLDEQQEKDIFITITSRPTALAKPSPQEAPAEEKSATALLQKRLFFPLSRALMNSRIAFVLYPKFSPQTAPHLKAPFAAQLFLLWLRAFRSRLPLQASAAALSQVIRAFTVIS